MRPWHPLVILALSLVPALAAADEVPADLSGFRPGRGVTVVRDGARLVVGWPIEGGESARMTLDLRPEAPLIERIALSRADEEAPRTLLSAVDPVTFVTVGTRHAPVGRPPGMSPFNVFFDSPAKRPHEPFRSRLDLRRARVEGREGRASVVLGDLTIGPFSGTLHLTVYAGARLVHVEAVVSTREPDRAFVYDAGLVADSPCWTRFAWTDTEGQIQREPADAEAADRAVPVRHRALAIEAGAGAVAAFPPPHQFFYPRDLTENQATTWFGRGHRGLEDRFGFGIRQTEAGGGGFVPWFNAPPGTEQRLGVFYLLAPGTAEDALREALRYTRGDRYPDLPGYRTFTSHWHMALAVAAMQEIARGGTRTVPDLVRMFKDMNVDIVHLAEFHGDGHPADPGPLRLPEMKAMFDECRRLSDDELLVLPGEEANAYLGVHEPGKHPGHWLYLFPRPVTWIMKRAPGEPFVGDDPTYGTVYRVGSIEDMSRLLERETGLAWTAHPRIKASSWTPDIFHDQPFYKADSWLGAAWKAMPADLSRPRLGERALDLLDDMANWGDRKSLLGEVDVFKIDHTHELYGHMNINYVRLDEIPRFEDDWGPLLAALRAGRFFVTTGEVILRDFTLGGQPSGSTVSPSDDDRPELRVELEWTFPLNFAEVISGDGSKVYRERIDLADTGPFGRRTLSLRPDLAGRKWARVEVWDVAADGAFTQPVWLEGGRD